jgi:hypothetical protein
MSSMSEEISTGSAVPPSSGMADLRESLLVRAVILFAVSITVLMAESWNAGSRPCCLAF